ncbi:hypothetical protein PPERSA_12228 [Pseudocohnilembus persalinus]|uniref:Uncharacterized protein n=1 Tax=Pseudocohnilembus persalinus TaxID=266149 RepID=A0A0V0R4S0_PSEPJ|nr:hypothetical protein PPERSA_12228 [Pseudocohnilembus persalinus]|eukprot:KRX09485.1 hypothetical protein PPERSA_12228 [Pseudocohnilembus persalinus]
MLLEQKNIIINFNKQIKLLKINLQINTSLYFKLILKNQIYKQGQFQLIIFKIKLKTLIYLSNLKDLKQYQQYYQKLNIQFQSTNNQTFQKKNFKQKYKIYEKNNHIKIIFILHTILKMKYQNLKICYLCQLIYYNF